MFRTATLLIFTAALALAGCASGRTLGGEAAVRLPARDAASIRIVERGVAETETVMTLQNALQAELLTRGLFRTVRDDGTDAPVRIDVALTDVREVTQGQRSFFGALAGAARIVARVDVYADGRQIDTFIAEGKSSSGSVMAGTTTQAAAIIARQIGDRIAAYPR